MAKLFKRYRKNGSYMWYVNYMDQGKFRMQSTGTSDKRLAERIQHEIEENQNRIKNGLEPVKKFEPILLSEFVEVYLEERRRLEKAPRTITTDEYALKRLMEFTGDCSLATITKDTVLRYRNHKLHRLNKTSVAIELRHLKAAFGWAAEKAGVKYLRRNPYKQKGLIPSPPRRSIPKCLSPEEKTRFLGAIDKERYRLLFQFFLLTGCRRGEAVKLEWEDVDLNRRVITFRRTKSGRDRVIPINLELMQVILALDRSQPKPWPYYPDWISHLFKRYLKAAGINKPLSLHSLRHTCGSDMARKGIPVNQIKDFLGHSSLEVTQIYLHSLPEDLRGAAEALSCLG